MSLKVGTDVQIRENYKSAYQIFGNKGKIKHLSTTCEQFTQAERVDFYDIEAISMITKKMELIPVKKIHVKPIEFNSVKSLAE